MNMNKIRENLKKRINHKNSWDKHVTILDGVGTMYSVLKWEYDNNKVEARSKDITNNRVECIMVTLKEFKEFINSLPDSYNDLRVCIGTSHVVLTPITTDYEIITENLYINCFEDY